MEYPVKFIDKAGPLRKEKSNIVMSYIVLSVQKELGSVINVNKIMCL